MWQEKGCLVQPFQFEAFYAIWLIPAMKQAGLEIVAIMSQYGMIVVRLRDAELLSFCFEAQFGTLCIKEIDVH